MDSLPPWIDRCNFDLEIEWFVKVQWSAISLEKHHTAAIVVASLVWTRAAKPFGYFSMC